MAVGITGSNFKWNWDYDLYFTDSGMPFNVEVVLFGEIKDELKLPDDESIKSLDFTNPEMYVQAMYDPFTELLIGATVEHPDYGMFVLVPEEWENVDWNDHYNVPTR